MRVTGWAATEFHCIENLLAIRDEGIKSWIDRQWQVAGRSVSEAGT